MAKNTWILDIECYPNFFYIGISDYRTGEKFDFRVNQYQDDRKQIFQVMSNYDGYLITFNGIHYDCVVIKFILKEWSKLSKISVKDFISRVKAISNAIIKDDYEGIKKYQWAKSPWTDIDLSCYWAKSLRMQKSISLKSLGIQLNHHRVQELPYPHDKILDRDEMEAVADYCLNNDIDQTTKLFVKMQPDVALRHYIKKEYGIECWSMDAPKIASEYLLKKFCEKTWDGKDDFSKYVNSMRRYKYQPPYGWKIGDYLPPVQFKTEFFQKLDKEIRECGREFSKAFRYEHGATKAHVSMGIGGIHIINKNEIYLAKKGFIIIDQDVASLYPQLIENHRFLRKELEIVIEEYLALKKDRISAKREGNKTKDIFLKLVLNAFTGIADSEVFWVYSPEHLTALRVYGQLIQLRVMEELSEIGCQVVSNNTDGTTAIVPEDKLDQYHEINRRIAEEFNVTWEYAVIDRVYYRDVNNYLCSVTKKYMIEDGKEVNVKEYKKDAPDIKKKGMFKYGDDIPLGDSVNEQVIPRALELYFLKDIPLEESIMNPDKYGFHIYDYCKSNKINKTYEVFYNGSKVQNLNRYYFSKGAPYLMKIKKGKQTFDHVNVGQGVILFNDFVEKKWEDYRINYQYYISKARKVVETIKTTDRELVLF